MKKKICIVMWYNQKISKFANLCYDINKKYCEIYGYDIIKSNIEHSINEKKGFEKFPLLLANISKYDYTIWLDADAHFYLSSNGISEIIEKYPNKDFILSGDKDIEKKSCFTSNKLLITKSSEINSGVLIVKNTKYAKDTLTRWISSDELMKKRHGKYTLYNLPSFIRQQRYNDQGIIRLYYYENIDNFREKTVILPLGIIQIFPFSKILLYYLKYPFFLISKPYIIHYAGVSNKKRIKRIKKYHQKYIKQYK